MSATSRGWVLPLLIAASVALYVASLGAGFTFDDWHTVVGHPGVRGPLSFDGILARDFWGHRFGDPDAVGTYRPLVTLSFWLEVHLVESTRLMHATNLALYAAVLFAGERFLRRFAPTSEASRLLAVAAFGALAIHTDVVPSITGRSELLASALTLIALERAIAAVEGGGWGAVVTACVAAIGAMSSKESAFATTLVLPWVAARRPQASRPKVLALAVGTVVPLAAMLVFRSTRLPLKVHGFAWQMSNPLLEAPFGARMLGAGEALMRYLEHTVAPLEACPDYGYATMIPGPNVRAAVGLVLLASLLVLSVLLIRRAPRVSDALMLGAASYVTISHVLVPNSAFVADRLFFLPSFFLIVLGVLAFDRLTLARHRLLASIAVGAFVVVQALFTVLSVGAWHDDQSLSAHAVEVCPTGMRMRVFRGETFHRAGQTTETAWSFLVGAAIYDHYPAPMADEDLPPEWERLPVEERVARLRAKLGPTRFARASAHALDALATKGWEDTRVIVRRWSAL